MKAINYWLCKNPYCTEQQKCVGLHAVENILPD